MLGAKCGQLIQPELASPSSRVVGAGFKSKASLYTHFKSKEEIASALLQEIIEQKDQVAMLAYESADPEPLHQ